MRAIRFFEYYRDFTHLLIIILPLCFLALKFVLNRQNLLKLDIAVQSVGVGVYFLITVLDTGFSIGTNFILSPIFPIATAGYNLFWLLMSQALFLLSPDL